MNPSGVFFIGLALIGAMSCTNTESTPRSSSALLRLDSIPDLPKVHAKSLQIGNISVAQYSNPKFLGAIQPLVNFKYTGSAEYIEVVTCVEGENKCSEPKNLFQDKSTLPNAPDGATVVVKLRACVSASRTLDSSNCGEWFQSSYKQWFTADKVKAALQEEQHRIEVDLKALREQLTNLLKLRAERASRCQARAGGDEALTQSLQADQVLNSALAKLGEGIVTSIGSAIVERSEGRCTRTQTAIEAKQNNEQEAQQSAGGTEGTPPKNSATGGTSGNRKSLPGSVDSIALLLNSPTSNSAAASYIDPGIYTPAQLKTITDSLGNAAETKWLQQFAPTSSGAQQSSASRTTSGSVVDKQAPQFDVSQCMSSAAAGAHVGGLTLNDVGEVIPDVANAIFAMNNADREAKAEATCKESLSASLDSAVTATTNAVGELITRLQERSATLKSEIAKAGRR